MFKLLSQISVSDLPVFDIFALPDDRTILDVIVAVINFLLGLASVLAILFIVVGGIRYIVSSGNPDQIEGAKKTITNAVIGLVVIILALVIVNTIKSVLGQ